MAARWLDILRRRDGVALGAALVDLAERASRMHREELQAGGVRVADLDEAQQQRRTIRRFDSSVPRPDR